MKKPACHPVVTGGGLVGVVRSCVGLEWRNRLCLITAGILEEISQTLYVLGFPGQEDLLKKLGKHKKSVACLYINKLEDVDLGVLTQIIKKSFFSKI